MADLTDIIPYVRPYVPDAGFDLIKQQIRASASEMARFTRAWQVDLPYRRVVEDVKKYTLESPLDGADILSIYEAKYKDDPTNARPNDPGVILKRDVDYRMIDRTTFEFIHNPTKSVSRALRIRVILVPCRDSDIFDEDLIEKHYETLAFGARSKLCLMPKKPFTNIGLGQDYENKFWDGLRNIAAEVTKRYTEENTVVQFYGENATTNYFFV